MSLGLDDEFSPGLYESVVDRDLYALISQFVADRAVLSSIDDADLPHVVAQHVAKVFERRLRAIKKEDRLKLASSFLGALENSSVFSSDDSNNYLVLTDDKLRAQYLAEVKETPLAKETIRPSTSLSEAALMTNAEHDVSLQAELSKEFASADRVDAIIAFVKWTGLTTLDQQFRRLRARGVPIRIITTTYTGATDRKALDHLVKEYGAQVKVNYKTTSTRLHAKAWMIYRNTGFHTAFVGSSNLSHSAIVDGLEWNVRIARTSTPAVFDKLESTFESYWNSPSFVPYDPDQDANEFDREIDRARHGSRGRPYLDFTALDIRPYPYQQAMLDALQASRNQGHHRNLIVAATGTGKTVVAAFDYKRLYTRLKDELGRAPRTLFVAHRYEILDQSARTFRDVTKNGEIGYSTSQGINISELTARDMARRANIVFATIQSLHAKSLETLPTDFFDILIIDEFHHAEAKSYQRLINYFDTRELIGLTATPERGDGMNVANRFFGGRIASELRLWDALEEELLCPFHYHVNADGTDLSSVKMAAGDYQANQLSTVLTGNDARVRLIVQAIQDKILDPNSMRALCFCVDIQHAEYMTQAFEKVGFKVALVTSRGSTIPRNEAIAQLKNGEVQIICTVDIFNEGVDVPEIDTILMLRPTQSPVIFLQQLGRGLRLAPGKTVLTVLDFVGNQAKGFRFDLKLRALTQTTRRGLEKGVRDGFSKLPAGSHIVFDEKSQEIVLRSIQENLNITTPKIPVEIRQFASARRIDLLSLSTYPLHRFLADAQRDLATIYGRSKWRNRPVSWQRLLHLARTGEDLPADSFDDIRNRLRVFCHVEDPDRVSAYRNLLTTRVQYHDLSDRDKIYAHMLMYTVWPNGERGGRRFESIDHALAVLRSDPQVIEEILQIMAYSQTTSHHLFELPKGRLSQTPLQVGAQYSREELLAALQLGFEFDGQAPGNMREGVKFCPRTNTDALLVTLVKSEADYSPQTLYRDYALTQNLFHWESQSTTSSDSPTGRRYREHAQRGSNIALFIRNHKKNDLGEGVPYTFAGPAHFVSSQGSKPMQIVWKLDHALPPELFIAARAVAS